MPRDLQFNLIFNDLPGELQTAPVMAHCWKQPFHFKPHVMNSSDSFTGSDVGVHQFHYQSSPPGTSPSTMADKENLDPNEPAKRGRKTEDYFKKFNAARMKVARLESKIQKLKAEPIVIQLEEKIKASKLQIKNKNHRLKRQSKRIDRLKKELKKTRKFTKKNYCDMSGKQKLSFRKDVLGKLNGAINDGNQHNDAKFCLFIAHLIKSSNNKLIMAQRLKSLIEEDAIGEAFQTQCG